MLRNCQDVFIAQCSSRRFLETLEDVIQSQKVSPVVRERLLEVLAGAAYSSPHSERDISHFNFSNSSSRLTISDGRDKDGFRGLWRKVKAPDQPDEVCHQRCSHLSAT